jgi:hypothetical protein
LQEVNEEREAKLVVVSVWRGAVCNGGAMVKRMVAVGFLVFVSSQRKEKRWRHVAGGGVEGKRG